MPSMPVSAAPFALAGAAAGWAVALACGALAAPSAADTTLVDGDIGSGTVTALRDRAVWSVPTSRGRYRLMQSVAGGRRAPVPGVPARLGPFDVDLGVDRANRLVATYSRCPRGRPSTPSGTMPVARFDRASGCRIYQHRFGERGERLLLKPRRGRSLYRPARWGGLLAMAELDERRSRDASDSVLVVVRDLQSGRRWRFQGTDPAEIPTWRPAGPGPLAVDLRDGRLAYGWADLVLACPSPHADYSQPLRTEVWTAAARGGNPVRLAEQCSSPSVFFSVLGVAVLADGDVLYGRNGPPAERGETVGALIAADASGASIPVSPPVPFVSSVAASEDRLFATTYIRGGDVIELPSHVQTGAPWASASAGAFLQ